MRGIWGPLMVVVNPTFCVFIGNYSPSGGSSKTSLAITFFLHDPGGSSTLSNSHNGRQFTIPNPTPGKLDAKPPCNPVPS